MDRLTDKKTHTHVTERLPRKYSATTSIWCCLPLLGMASRGKSANPIAHVLQALGSELELIEYEGWNVMLPEGTFYTKVSYYT